MKKLFYVTAVLLILILCVSETGVYAETYSRGTGSDYDPYSYGCYGWCTLGVYVEQVYINNNGSTIGAVNLTEIFP